MNLTNQYYSENAQAFFDTTVRVNVKKLYDRFVPRIKPGGQILDAGCGSGRDSKHFKDLGFKVTAFDANESLVQLAADHLEQTVIHASFDTFVTHAHRFDGIWACASLLHVPRCQLPSVLLNLGHQLKPEGIFYCSFKYGEAEVVRNGRYFTDLNESTLQNVLIGSNLIIDDTWISSDARPDRESEQWLNAILVKG